MRRALILVLFAWWYIPAMWIIALPCIWLLEGDFKQRVWEFKEVTIWLLKGYPK